MTSRRAAWILAAGLTALSACGRSDNATSRAAAGPRFATAADLTPAERQWGVGPKRDPRVTYQPDVVIIDEGPEAVRAVSGNGLEWTIDASAGHAADLKPGSILFATSRAVGRVLGLRREGATVVATLGPVALTDVVRDATIAVDQPIDLAQAIVYSAPDLPGTSSPAEPLLARGVDSEGTSGFVRTGSTGRLQSGPGLRFASNLKVGDFSVTPSVSLSGIGATVTSDNGSLRFVGDASIRLQQPRLSFALDISGGVLTRCELQLTGAAGVVMQLSAASAVGAKGDVARTLHVPADFSIPLLGEAVPFAVTIRQSFVVKTRFGAKGVIQARGDYKVSGGFSVGYRDGQLGVTGPSGFSAAESLLDSVSGVSQAPSGLLLTHQIRVIVGIGALGFVTGPYFALTTSMGASRHSDLDTLARCRGEVVTVNLGAGVGYFMPRIVTEGINTVLRALNLGEIANEGGIALVESAKLINRSDFTPKIKGCGA